MEGSKRVSLSCCISSQDEVTLGSVTLNVGPCQDFSVGIGHQLRSCLSSDLPGK